MAKSLIDFIKKPGDLFVSLGHRGFWHGINDETYIRIAYRTKTGKKLNLESPRTFNEKLQWLKLHDRDPVHTVMADKYLVKNYVAERIGEEHIIPTLGVWDRFEDIEFDSLPESFVLKCTHDSGGLVICRNKSEFDFDAAKSKINTCLSHNFFWGQREWPYKDIKPRVIAEKFMQEQGQSDSDLPVGLTDYKFYCFNGEPLFLYLSKGLEDHSTARISFVDLDWQFSDFQRADYAPFETLPPKPAKLDEMIDFARELSGGNRFVRVDLYEINGTVYFSEFTFFPVSGYMPFKNESDDVRMGDLLAL